MVVKKIAVLCNYELLPERIGGMDQFFWQFDAKCKANNIAIDWFFPNIATHGNYSGLTIMDCNHQNVEGFFLDYCEKNKTNYANIITHFVELCTPFFKKIKPFSAAKIIAVDHNPRPINGYPLKKKLEKAVKGFLYAKHIDVFVGVSDYCKNQLISEFGKQISNKVVVIFNGLEITKFKKKTNFDFKRNFIVASHLRKEKGVQDLIAAVQKLEEHLKSIIKIDIYGEGYFETELKALIDQSNLKNVFSFKGSVSNLNEIYCNYDYLIHPSHGETFCYSVVEGLLSNLPVITTNKEGNVLNLVKENSNGFLHDATDINKLSSILTDILTHKIKIENGLQKESGVTQLSLEQMVSNHFILLSDISITTEKNAELK